MWYVIIYTFGLVVGVFIGYRYGYRNGYNAIRGISIPKGTTLADAFGRKYETEIGVTFETPQGANVKVPVSLK